MDVIEVEDLSPEREFVPIKTERRLAPGDLVHLRDRHGHACSGVVAVLNDDLALPGQPRLAVRLDVADWRGEAPGI